MPYDYVLDLQNTIKKLAKKIQELEKKDEIQGQTQVQLYLPNPFSNELYKVDIFS